MLSDPMDNQEVGLCLDILLMDVGVEEECLSSSALDIVSFDYDVSIFSSSEHELVH